MSEIISCREWVLSQVNLIRDDLKVLETVAPSEEGRETVTRCIKAHLQNIEKEVSQRE